MIRRAAATAIAIAAMLAIAGSAHAAEVELVFCAPGYPGSTEQAAPTMAAFADALAAESGLTRAAIAAAYHETEAGGVAAIEAGDPAVVLATLPFWLAHRDRLGLRPRLLAIPPAGATEVWTLVAARGRVARPADLAGFAIESIAGYAPAFVRGPALGAWGALPDSASIVFTSRVLSSLRRAAAGETVAVLLDGAQASGLDRLPFAGDLEVVTRSAPVPAYVVSVRGGRDAERPVAAVVAAFGRLASSAPGRVALAGIRLERFEAVPDGALDAATTAFDRAAAP